MKEVREVMGGRVRKRVKGRRGREGKNVLDNLRERLCLNTIAIREGERDVTEVSPQYLPALERV